MYRLLMQPGPTEVDPRVVQALAEPAINHQSAEFAAIVDATCDYLQKIFDTEGEVVLLPASGRGGLEAAVSSFYRPDAPVLILSNGVFGNMLATISRSLGAPTVTLTCEPGTVFSLEEVEKAIRQHRPHIVGVVQGETSSSMLNDVRAICQLAREYGALTLVDAVASLGGTEMHMDAWSVDICVTAAQKALGGLAGVSAVAIGPRARQALHERPDAPRGMYLDLKRWYDMWLPKEKGGLLKFGYRRLPWTHATHLVMAWEEACRIIVEEETIEARVRRHRRAGRAVYGALKTAGLQPVCPPEAALPTVTAFFPPEGVSANELIASVREGYGIQLSGGLEQLYGRIVRVAHMAETARKAPLFLTLSALEAELRKRGVLAPDSRLAETFVQLWDEEAGE